MIAPQRVQLRRTKGWRKPTGAVVITRATRWGNPYTVEQYGRDRALELYRRDLRNGGVQNVRSNGNPFPVVTVDDIRRHFADVQIVACACEVGQACHGDIIRAVAAGEAP